MVAAVASSRSAVCVLVQPPDSQVGVGIRRACQGAGLSVVAIADGASAVADDSIAVDLLDEAEVKGVAKRVTDAHLVRALVIVNALGESTEFRTADPDTLRRQLEDPCLRFFNVTQAFWSAVAEGAGSIVNVVPVRSARGDVPTAGEAMSRGVLWQLTRSLAVELAEYGVTVNGVVVAPLGDDDKPGVMRRSPLRRGPTVDEIGATVRFLMSPESSYTTGTFVQLDGGNTAKL